MSERGVHLKEVLEQKDKEKKWLQVLAETESDESIEKGEVTDDSEEEDQVDAYGIDVEEKMTEIANKKMLELELPLEDLPKDVLEMIEEGPQSRPMSERGVHLKEVLEQKEKEKKWLKVLAETE